MKGKRALDASFTPVRLDASPRSAIALGVETVRVKSGNEEWEEVVRLIALDFFTLERLVYALICPTLGRVIDWRLSKTALNSELIERALVEGKAFDKWKEARAALWRFIDRETVIVGHDLRTAFEGLGMLHLRVVDTAIIASQIGGLGHDCLDIESLCKDLVDEKIYWDCDSLHECSFRASAAREFVIWSWTSHHADELAVWGQISREQRQFCLRQEAEARAGDPHAGA